MTRTLNQSEIDALVRSLGKEGLSTDGPARIFSRTRRDFERVEIRSYDFKRPERINQEQIRALHTLHESFVRTLTGTLSGFLRTITEVRVVHTQQMTYGEFIAGLPNPTCFALVDATPLEEPLCLELSPLVVYPLLDRLLGGTNQHLFIPQREMTPIEGRLVRTILERVLGCLAQAWSGVRTIEFGLREVASNPDVVQILPPNELVVVVGFEIKLNERAGTMSLCLPFGAIEPLLDDLTRQSWTHAARAAADDPSAQRIESHLGAAPITVTGVLAETRITFGEFSRLEVGDIITTDRPATAPVTVEVTGRPKFLAELGRHRDRRALRILRPVTESDLRRRTV